MKEENYESWLILIAACLSIGVLVGALLARYNPEYPINISSETGNTLCNQITNNSAVVASSDSTGHLICMLPSEDHTQDIIIKNNGGS